MHPNFSSNAILPASSHKKGLQRAHAQLEERLRHPTWGADDFYSAMATYREAAGIAFRNDDDPKLDKWLDAAETAWKQELTAKGDRINLGEALDKAIAGGMKALGFRIDPHTRRRPGPHRDRNSRGSLHDGRAGLT